MKYKLITFVLTVFLLNACTTPASTPPSALPEATPAPSPTAELQPTQPAPEANTVTEISYMLWGSPEEAAILQSVVEEFEKQNPSIKVKVEVSEWDVYWDKLKTLHASGTPPDVFAIDGPLYADWLSRGAFLNLQPFLDKEAETLTGIYPIVLESYKRADGYYALPRDIQTIALFYNKDLFDKAGVDYPTDTWTMDDFRTAAKKLSLDTDHDGTVDQWGFLTDFWDMELFWSTAIWSHGGELISADGSKTLLGEPKAREGWALIETMMKEDHSIPNTATLSADEAFAKGKVAMTTSGHWVVPEYAELDFAWDVAPMPIGPAGRVTSVTSGGFVISKQTKNAEAAWKFVKYGISEAAQKRMSELGFAIPILEKVAQSPVYMQQAVPINHRVFVDALEYAHPKPNFKGYEEWATVIGDGMQPVWDGDKTVDETLKELLPLADEVLARNKE